MRMYRRTLMVGIVFVAILSLNVTAASAAQRPRCLSSSGMQIPDPLQSYEDVTYINGPNYVIVKGARMINSGTSTTPPTPDPYDFGVVQVYSETIE